jgi:hypothetical protein
MTALGVGARLVNGEGEFLHDWTIRDLGRERQGEEVDVVLRLVPVIECQGDFLTYRHGEFSRFELKAAEIGRVAVLGDEGDLGNRVRRGLLSRCGFLGLGGVMPSSSSSSPQARAKEANVKTRIPQASLAFTQVSFL